MPYSIRTKDGIVINNVPDDVTPDSLQIKQRVQRVRSGNADMQRMADPTSGMSGLEKFRAGTGKAFADIGRGAAQLVNMGPSGEEVREMRQRDAPLMSTGAGFAGNVAGNVAALAPAALLPGAGAIPAAGALGAVTAGLQPTETTAERLGKMAFGGFLGAGVQTVARYPLETAEVVKNVVTGPFKALKAAVEPFYQGGREKILSRALQQAVGEGNVPRVTQNLRNAQVLVPGSVPTAAEAGQSGGLAALQRSAAAVDPESYTTRAVQQNEARVRALRDMAGTQGARDFASANRSGTAQQLYDQAYDLGVDLSKLSPARRGEITKLLRTPAISNAVKEAKLLARNEMVKINDPAGSVKGLDYVKRALDDQISRSTGNEQRVLVGLKNRLLTTIDTLSPEYAAARKVFQDMSKPINQMDIAQHIADKSIRPLDDTLQPAAFARALSDDSARAATGFNKATLADVLDPSQMRTLHNLREDLARTVAARDLGRGPGSDTTQKLAMTNLLQRAGLPEGVLNMPMLGRVGNWIYRSADEQMKQQLAQSLLNPQEAARLMQAAPRIQPPAQTPQLAGEKAAMLARMLSLPQIPILLPQEAK